MSASPQEMFALERTKRSMPVLSDKKETITSQDVREWVKDMGKQLGAIARGHIRKYCSLCGKLAPQDPDSQNVSKEIRCHECRTSESKAGEIKYCQYCGEAHTRTDFIASGKLVCGWGPWATCGRCEENVEKLKNAIKAAEPTIRAIASAAAELGGYTVGR